MIARTMRVPHQSPSLKPAPNLCILLPLFLLIGCTHTHTAPRTSEPAPTPIASPSPTPPESVAATPARADEQDDDDAQSLAGPKVLATDYPQTKVVNTMCPMIQNRPVGVSGMCNNTLTRTFKGKAVGFCCESCVSDWDVMSDDDKQAALDAVVKK